MKTYLSLNTLKIAAFFFTEREKDYGGIHLCISTSSIKILLALTDELSILSPNHSRSLPLLSVPATLPRYIAVHNHYKPLVSLRIGMVASSITQIRIDEQAGIITLSQNGLSEFKNAIILLHKSNGDLLISGDSTSWTDRLWFWPFE